MDRKWVLLLSTPLGILLVIVSCIGMMPGFYNAETLNWKTQSLAQDQVDLFLVFPSLLFSSLLVYRNRPKAILFWGGTVLYIAYTFVIYCFSVHFNSLFLLYCLCLGLSFYASLFFLLSCLKNNPVSLSNQRLNRMTGVYFIIIAMLFYGLWLSEILPAIFQNAVPKTITDAGLFTNAVHVLDLSVLLPALFCTGILLLKNNSFARSLAPALLFFFILMDLTIAYLALAMEKEGLGEGSPVAFAMGILAALSLGLLTAFLTKKGLPSIS